MGTLYYVAWATGQGAFDDAGWVWSTAAFTVALSVVVHGITSTPLMRRLREEPSGNAG